MNFDYIFDMMRGLFDEQDPDIKNLFEGECEEIYQKIFDARCRISPNGESKDLLEIVEGYEKLIRIFSEYAYLLGKRNIYDSFLRR